MCVYFVKDYVHNFHGKSIGKYVIVNRVKNRLLNNRCSFATKNVAAVDKIQCWPKETLQALFYEAKVPTSDGYSTT